MGAGRFLGGTATRKQKGKTNCALRQVYLILRNPATRMLFQSRGFWRCAGWRGCGAAHGRRCRLRASSRPRPHRYRCARCCDPGDRAASRHGCPTCSGRPCPAGATGFCESTVCRAGVHAATADPYAVVFQTGASSSPFDFVSGSHWNSTHFDHPRPGGLPSRNFPQAFHGIGAGHGNRWAYRIRLPGCRAAPCGIRPARTAGRSGAMRSVIQDCSWRFPIWLALISDLAC